MQTCAARLRHPFRPLGDGYLPKNITLDDLKFPVITTFIISLFFSIVGEVRTHLTCHMKASSFPLSHDGWRKWLDSNQRAPLQRPLP